MHPTPDTPSTPAPRLTLAQWADRWPYRVTAHSSGLYVTPDTIDAPPGVRAAAFALCDALVTSVSGGSIWFCLDIDRVAVRDRSR